MSKKNDETLAPEVADRESFQTFSPDSTPADVVTHDSFIDSKIQDIVREQLKAINQNVVYLGCTISSKDVKPGKFKKDSSGADTSERWPDTYTVDIQFQGGGFSVRVDPMQYALLEADGTHYLAKGVVSSKTNDYGYHVADMKILSFERLF